MDSTTIENIRALLTSGVMTYAIYDANTGLMTHLYETQHDAIHGDPCLLTEYKYVVDSSDILGSRETVTAWDSAWSFDNL